LDRLPLDKGHNLLPEPPYKSINFNDIVPPFLQAFNLIYEEIIESVTINIPKIT